jgi:1-acyl-sn-glycerol-3-phosphate acyltransferase
VSVLAIVELVPIVPVYLSGLESIRPKGAKGYTPGAAGVEFLPPLAFARSTAVEDATQRLRSAMNARHVAALTASEGGATRAA